MKYKKSIFLPFVEKHTNRFESFEKILFTFLLCGTFELRQPITACILMSSILQNTKTVLKHYSKLNNIFILFLPHQNPVGGPHEEWVT